MEKKTYESAEMEMIELKIEEIVTTSLETPIVPAGPSLGSWETGFGNQ